MKGLIKSILSFLLPKALYDTLISFKNLYITRFATKCYSHEGEDLLLSRIFGDQKDGFYVDVGAHHPFRFSNTYLLYKRGWRGINIDAMPGSMKLFNRFRPRDINIECGVASGGGIMTYYSFNEPALNGFAPELKTKYTNHSIYHLVEEIPVPVGSLESILDEYLPQDISIDFFSIDTEGLDLEVLSSNNWAKYYPRIILVEYWDSTLENVWQTDIYTFLSSKGYVLFAKTMSTLFFRRIDA